MKTLHRAAYEVLTPEEYKEFCRIPKELFGNSLRKDHWDSPTTIIGGSFKWASAPYTIKGEGPTIYWGKIYLRFINRHA